MKRLPWKCDVCQLRRLGQAVYAEDLNAGQGDFSDQVQPDQTYFMKSVTCFLNKT